MPPFIDGRFVSALSGKTFSSENPATGKSLANIAACDSEDVDRAVLSARKAFDKGIWSRRSPVERKKILLRMADLIEQCADEFAVLDCLDSGKPISDCVNIDIPDSITAIRWHAESIDKIYGHVAPTGSENLGLIVREPIGVVGCVIPWNFPLMMAAWKLAPALAAGNSVVLKPAEQTSFSALRLAELAAEAGVPEAVLSVVPGFGETAGQAIGRHRDIDMVAFTGSTDVGRLFLKYSAETNLKRIVLECGGKSPQLVLADAPDLDFVARHAVNAAYWNMGENCSCGSRLIVHQDVKDELLERMIAQSREWIVGDPLDPLTRVGALIEKTHLDKVLGYIDSGCADGARIVLGGNRVLSKSGGYFIEPTIFDDARNDMKIAQEEVFGPVVVTIPFSTIDEGVAIANDTQYGLAASLYTDNVHTAHRVSRALRAGTVSVNCYSEGDITTPFGGFKQSGFAGRDKSIFAHEQYTELKTIWMQFN
jgi:gamma-glutamyl-gamma-aminobutyraldehyde dehydrogenase